MAHGKPKDGAECMACMDDIDCSNYIEYRDEEGGAWMPSQFCETCVLHLLSTQWNKYCDDLAKATCKAEQRRLLGRGPPVMLRDKTALPCKDDGEVHSLWFASSDKEQSAKLVGSLEGTERQVWWDEKLAFQFDEPDEPPAAGEAQDGKDGGSGGSGGSGA